MGKVKGKVIRPMKEIVSEQIVQGNDQLYYFSRRHGFILDDLKDWAEDLTPAYITIKGYIYMQRHDGEFSPIYNGSLKWNV